MMTHSFRRKWIGLFLALVFTSLWLFFGKENGEVKAFGVTLRPPFNDAADGSTYRITSYFDHYYPNYTGDPDNPNITVYTGETVVQGYPYEYRGHPGYDFGMNIGVSLYATADGVARIDNDPGGTLGRWVCIQHTGNLATIYGHMNTIAIQNGPVGSGQLIGTSGNTGTTGAHLHLSVVSSSCNNAPSEINPIDPFGWQGDRPDPVFDYSGISSSCLWRSADQDPISCADRVYEDGSLGTSITGGGWWEENDGHGYQKYRRYNSTGNEIGSWMFSVPSTRPAKVYAWIPSLATTQQARYGIWTAYGWQYVTINQSIDQNRWRLLGTFMFNSDPINNYVILSANTGEPVGTKWVAVDGIKFRTYFNNLPITFKDYCSPSTEERLVNGNFNTGTIDGWEWFREPPSPGLPIVLAYGSSEYGARLGGIVDTHDYIMQATCIPEDTNQATLTYSIWISSEEPLNEPEYDRMVVSVKDQNGVVMREVDYFYNTSPRGVWLNRSIDLSDFSGQMIKISFEAWNDNMYRTHFWIDNVSFRTYP